MKMSESKTVCMMLKGGMDVGRMPVVMMEDKRLKVVGKVKY